MSKVFLFLWLLQVCVADEVTPFSYLVTPPSTYTGGVFATDCNLGNVRGLQRCPATARLTDNVTNEGTGFEPNNTMGWDQSFMLEFNFVPDVYITQADIYFYNRPTEGYGLPDVSTSISFDGTEDDNTPLLSTYTDNSQLSRTDNEVQVVSMVVLTPFSNYRFFRLYFNFSSYTINQTFLSELRFFTDTSSAVDNGPIEFLSPNQSVQLGPLLQSSVQLTCTVANNGSFVWLSWTGPAVDNNKTQVQLADTSRTSILTISGLSADDSGIYTCTVAYSRSEAGGIPPAAGRLQSRQTLNNVIFVLMGSVLTVSPVEAELETNVSLQCNFTGYLPTNYEVIWSFGSDLITNMDDINIITKPTGSAGQSQRGGSTVDNGISSTLTIVSVDTAHIGSYTCEMVGTNLRETIDLILPLSTTTSDIVLSSTIITVSQSAAITPSTTSTSDGTATLIILVSSSFIGGIVIILLIVIPVLIAIIVIARTRIAKAANVPSSAQPGVDLHPFNFGANSAYGVTQQTTEPVYEELDTPLDYEKPIEYHEHD